jgi:hypothetical protein
VAVLHWNLHFPGDSTFVLDDTRNENHVYWEYNLPLATSTKDWDDVVQGSQYWMEVTAYKGEQLVTYRIEDIDITGNTFDLVYIQPVDSD